MTRWLISAQTHWKKPLSSLPLLFPPLFSALWYFTLCVVFCLFRGQLWIFQLSLALQLCVITLYPLFLSLEVLCNCHFFILVSFYAFYCPFSTICIPSIKILTYAFQSTPTASDSPCPWKSWLWKLLSPLFSASFRHIHVTPIKRLNLLAVLLSIQTLSATFRAGSCSACCPPRPWGPLPQSCSPATQSLPCLTTSLMYSRSHLCCV